MGDEETRLGQEQQQSSVPLVVEEDEQKHVFNVDTPLSDVGTVYSTGGQRGGKLEDKRSERLATDIEEQDASRRHAWALDSPIADVGTVFYGKYDANIKIDESKGEDRTPQAQAK